MLVYINLDICGHFEQGFDAFFCCRIREENVLRRVWRFAVLFRHPPSYIIESRIYRARSLQRVKSPDQTDTEQNPNFIVDPLRDQKTSVAVTN